MEYEKLTYTNERGESIELSTESVYHCNVSKDVDGIAGVTNVVYSTNSIGQHGDTYVGQRIEARDHRHSGAYQHTGQAAGIPNYAASCLKSSTQSLAVRLPMNLAVLSV